MDFTGFACGLLLLLLRMLLPCFEWMLHVSVKIIVSDSFNILSENYYNCYKKTLQIKVPASFVSLSQKK